MKKIVNEEMMSAVKRKNVKDMLALILLADGNEKGSTLVRNAGRITEKLLKDAGCYSEPEEECCTTEEDTSVTINEEDPFKFNELDTLIAKGKKKKAKKLLKEIEESGLKGSELSKRKALVKAL